eukprot:403347232
MQQSYKQNQNRSQADQSQSSPPIASTQLYHIPYEKDIISLLEQALAIQEQVKSQPHSEQKKVKKIDGLLQQAHSYIMQLQIDQKSMPPSQKKKDLKTKLSEYNAKYHQLEVKQNQFKALIITDDEMEFDEDEEELIKSSFKGQESNRKKNNKYNKSKAKKFRDEEYDQERLIQKNQNYQENRSKLSSSQKEIEHQNKILHESIRSGYQTQNLAMQAMLAIKGQRDQIVNTVGLVRDIGLDLVRGDKLIKDINKRRLVNIVILYMIILLLFITNILVMYFKLHF